MVHLIQFNKNSRRLFIGIICAVMASTSSVFASSTSPTIQAHLEHTRTIVTEGSGFPDNATGELRYQFSGAEETQPIMITANGTFINRFEVPQTFFGKVQITAKVRRLVSPSTATSSTIGSSTTSSTGSSITTSTPLKTSGQVKPKSGETVTGLRISNPSGSCVVVDAGVTNVTIEGNDIGPCGSDVDDVGIYLAADTSQITASNNLIHNVATGLYANHAKNPIVFKRNTVFDVRGPFPRGQMLQFDNVTGEGQSSVTYNVSDKQLATVPTRYEDHISMYMSAGNAQTPILIGCNKLHGGDSVSGSGIVVGDYGGQYFDIRNNIILYTANVGIGIAGAKNAVISGNIINNAGKDKASMTQIALYVMTYADSVPENITLKNNHAIARNWIQGDGSTTSGYWSDASAKNLQLEGNVWPDENLTESIWNQSPTGCN